MTTLTAKLALSIAAAYADAPDIGTLAHEIAFNPNWVFTDGTGADQAKKVFADTRTLSASASENLDLAGGLNDAFGNALTFTKVKALIVIAAAANANDVLVGGAASNGFITPFGDATDVIKVKPGGALMMIAPDATGLAVTAGTGDILKVANSAGGTSVTYTIIVVGVG